MTPYREGSFERDDISIDATFVDGFDVDDEEDRWLGPADTMAPSRIRHRCGGMMLSRGR